MLASKLEIWRKTAFKDPSEARSLTVVRWVWTKPGPTRNFLLFTSWGWSLAISVVHGDRSRDRDGGTVWLGLLHKSLLKQQQKFPFYLLAPWANIHCLCRTWSGSLLEMTREKSKSKHLLNFPTFSSAHCWYSSHFCLNHCVTERRGCPTGAHSSGLLLM